MTHEGIRGCPLAENFEVFAMDLVGFGKSGRRSGPLYFDYPLWLRQAAALLDRIQGERIGVTVLS